MDKLYSVHIDSPPDASGHWQSGEIVCVNLEEAQKVAAWINNQPDEWTVDSVAPTELPSIYTFESYLKEFG